jgi:hypothetical protein
LTRCGVSEIAFPIGGSINRARQKQVCLARNDRRDCFYWQLYMMPSPPLTIVPGVQPMPARWA